MNWRVGALAVAAVASLFAVLQWQASRTTTPIGFWYEDSPFLLDETATAQLGGPLTEVDLESIKRVSRNELEHAFSGLRIVLTENQNAFWRVQVVPSLGRAAGATYHLGPFGGRGSVGVLSLAFGAIKYAPRGASRQTMIDAIGRGIGRSAAHELAHAIVGADALMDNQTDKNSYEYFSSDRPSQYYGELHWTSAWPILEQRFGNTVDRASNNSPVP